MDVYPNFDEDIDSFEPVQYFNFGDSYKPQFNCFQSSLKKKSTAKPQSKLFTQTSTITPTTTSDKSRNTNESPDDDVPGDNATANYKKCETMSLISEFTSLKLDKNKSSNDCRTEEDIENETVALLRFCGFDPIVETMQKNDFRAKSCFNQKNVEYIHSGRGRQIPLFLNSKYFKLKPMKDIENQDAIDLSKFNKKDGSLDFKKLKATLETKMPLAQRIARLNNLPDPYLNREEKQTQDIISISNEHEPTVNIPWSKRKNMSKSLMMALALADSDSPEPTITTTESVKPKALSYAEMIENRENFTS